MARAWWHASLLLVCMALPLQLAHGQTRQSGRGASVALTAKWNSTATVLEAAEFLVSAQMHPLVTPPVHPCCYPTLNHHIKSLLSQCGCDQCPNLHACSWHILQADESPAQFWAFVDAWSARGGVNEAAGGQDCWTQIITAAAAHVPPSLGRLLPVVLASRQYSPRLELFATLAAEAAPPQQVRPLPHVALLGMQVGCWRPSMHVPIEKHHTSPSACQMGC